MRGHTVGHSKRHADAAPTVRDLTSHEKPFVTTADLADYWGVSRRHIHKQIEQGDLPAVRLGPRSFRVATQDAVEFEKRRTFAPSGCAHSSETETGRRSAPAPGDGHSRRRSS
jgi:excisionase family DNA binding protein